MKENGFVNNILQNICKTKNMQTDLEWHEGE